MSRLGFEPMISTFEVNPANPYAISFLLGNWQLYLFNIHGNATKSETWPLKILMCVLPEFF